MFPITASRLRATLRTGLCLAALSGGITLLAACATSGGMEERGMYDPVGLLVRNDSWNSVTVYVARGGVRWRLGDVSVSSTEFFPAERLDLAGNLDGAYLVARPLGQPAFRSEPLIFAPGKTLVWTIANQRAHSYLSVR